MRTSNPTLQADTFDVRPLEGEGTMTIYGTVCKTAVLAILVFISAAWAWHKFPPVPQPDITSLWDIRYPAGSIGYILLSLFGGIIAALLTGFLPRLAWLGAPLYALAEGIFLGIFSAMAEGIAPGIVVQAIGLTTGTLLALLFVYMTGIIRATDNFKLMIAAATGGIALVYLLTIILSLFGVRMPFVHDAGIGGIIFSLIVVGVAAFNLVLDFDFIEEGSQKGAPYYLEWYAAFGLMVTLIWLYIEVVKLLLKWTIFRK